MKKTEMVGKPHQSGRRITLTEDFIWGLHPVQAALQEDPGRLLEVFLLSERKGKSREEIISLARHHGIKLTFLPSFHLTGTGADGIRHQGILARLAAVPLLSFETLLQRFAARVKAGEKPRLVACDNLQDPHNIGAIIRSALAAGACGVIVTRERSAPLGGTVAKASAGALSSIDVCQVTNLVQSLKQLKKAGAWIFGAVKDAAAQSLYATDLRLPACLVIGGEGKGVRPLVRSECDMLLSIPMEGNLESLNSSVATAVILFEAFRQSMST